MGKQECLSKTDLSEQGRESTTNSTHIWCQGLDSNPGRIGGAHTTASSFPPMYLYPITMLFIAVLWKFRSKDGVFSFFFFAHYDVLFACLKRIEFFLFPTNSGSVFYTVFAVKTEKRWVLFLRYMNHSSSLFTVFFFYFVWI